MPVIDIHASVGVVPEDDRPRDAATLLRRMDRFGVDQALCTHAAAVRYDARQGNDLVVERCRREPRLHPVAVVHPGRHVGVAEEIRRCAQAGCVGLRFLPGAQGWALDAEPFLHALRTVVEEGLPLAIEVARPGDATRVALLSQQYGVSMVLANVTYALLGEAIAAIEHQRDLFLEACRLATPGVVELLVERLGADRLLFGSGAPDWEMAPTLAMVRAAEIPDAAKEAILGRNAQALYGLPEGGAG